MAERKMIIAGGGFAGIYAAWRLAREGYAVDLIEAAPTLGGNLNSREWNGYWLDNGTHNFDMRSDLGAAFYPDILGNDLLVFEDQQWATTNDKTWISGFELPDFTDEPEFAARALAELAALEHAAAGPPPETYADVLLAKFGPALAARLSPMVKKYTGADPAEISADAAGLLGMFSRVRLGTDDDMLALKRTSSFWDDRLGVSLYCGDADFIGLNANKIFAFPARKGLTGFCEAADRRLRALGVAIRTGAPVDGVEHIDGGIAVTVGEDRIEGRALFWSLPETHLMKIIGADVDLMSSAHPVGTAFFAFEVDQDAIVGPDYLHDYSGKRLPFRYNKAGVYGAQTKPDGRTYVTCEMPGHPKDLRDVITDDNAQAAWDALRDVGYLRADAVAHDRFGWSHPVAYTLPKTGWRDGYDAAQAAIQAASPNIHGIAFGYRGRLAFMRFFEDTLGDRLRGALA
ncbi:MAG: NAD(P)-binding protein [Rhodobacteraceae bacterium]|nr:NAD(P)-binding protein [Paracoccaceae bacterium]